MSHGHPQPWWHKTKKHTALFAFIASACFVFLLFGVMYYGNKKYQESGPRTNTYGGTNVEQEIATPKRLLIPKINVDANIQKTGLMASGRMGIPSNFTDVAWYKLGPKPGEFGTAVIDGHLDTVVDDNAVFSKLSELKKGDDIFVVDANEQKIHFRVYDTQVYDNDKAPIDTIFDSQIDRAKLNIITCDGAWSQKQKNYDQRLVVYSERID